MFHKSLPSRKHKIHMSSQRHQKITNWRQHTFVKFWGSHIPQESSQILVYFSAGSIRKSSPVVVVSLLILIVALGFSTVGNTKRDTKTVYGAVLYVTGGESANLPCSGTEIKKPCATQSSEGDFLQKYLQIALIQRDGGGAKWPLTRPLPLVDSKSTYTCRKAIPAATAFTVILSKTTWVGKGPCHLPDEQIF